MGSFFLSLRVVLPLFLMMCCGGLLRCSGKISHEGFSHINALNFNLGFPAVLISSMYSCDLSRTNYLLALFNCSILLALFFLYSFLLPRVEPDKRRRAVMIQGLLRGNATIYGLALATALVSPEDVGTVMLTFVATVPLLNVLSVYVLGTCGAERADIGRTLLRILRNPFIVSILLGILLNVLRISLPGALYSAVSDIGKIATPLAFICLGGAFDAHVIAPNKKTLLLVLFLRLLAVPALVMPLAVRMGFRGPEIISVLCVFATPTAVASFPLAKSMGGDADLAAGIVFSTTLLSVLTFIGWISLLSSAQLI